MKKVVVVALFALFALPVLLMLSVTVHGVEGGSAQNGPWLEVTAGETFTSGRIKTGGADGAVFCWEKPFWEAEMRTITITLLGQKGNPILKRTGISPYHACVEVHSSAGFKPPPKGYWMELSFGPLPDPLRFKITPQDGRPLKLLATGDGRLRAWLMKQSKFGDRFFENFGLMLERASHYKPFTPSFGYALFFVWFPILGWTLFRLFRFDADGD